MLLALLLGVGLTAVLAAAAKAVDISSPVEKQQDARKSQVLLLNELQPNDGPSLPASNPGRSATGRAISRRRDLAADTAVESSSRDEEARNHAPAHPS